MKHQFTHAVKIGDSYEEAQELLTFLGRGVEAQSRNSDPLSVLCAVGSVQPRTLSYTDATDPEAMVQVTQSANELLASLRSARNILEALKPYRLFLDSCLPKLAAFAEIRGEDSTPLHKVVTEPYRTNLLAAEALIGRLHLISVLALSGKLGRVATRPHVSPAEAVPAETPAIPPRQKGKGRQRSESTAEVYEFCYEQRKAKSKRPRVLKDAKAKFGDRAPQREEDVTLYARRHAERNGLPWPLPGA